MLQHFLDWDKNLFLYLNSKHSVYLDPIMLFLSSDIGWTLVSLLLLGVTYFKGGVYKKAASLFFLIALGACALLTNIIKEIVQRPRPIHNAAWNNTIHAIEDFDNSYSFFSSHSATTFTMAIFFFLFFRMKNKLYGYVAIFWASTVAYSRIYLAKHYPSDVICGILFGIAMGILGYKLFEYYIKKQGALKS